MQANCLLSVWNMNLCSCVMVIVALLPQACFAQQSDSVAMPQRDAYLFVAPKGNLLVTHIDATVGASRVTHKDESPELGFSATVKGLYALTGAIYLNMGLGITRLNSRLHANEFFLSEKYSSTIVTLPVGIGFAIGDDRAQIVNSIDFFPAYYVDFPHTTRPRQFSYGVGVDMGFHIRIRERMHLGMMGKLQLFQPFSKDDPRQIPQYGFVGGGILLRYD